MEQGVEIILAGGGQEGRDDFVLLDFGSALTASPHPAAGAAGELTGGGFRPAHDGERIKALGTEFALPPTEVPGTTIVKLNDTCGISFQITQLARW